MSRIVLDASDLHHLELCYRDIAANLIGNSDHLRWRTNSTFINYADPAMARNQPESQAYGVSRSVVSLAEHLQADRREIQRILGVVTRDLDAEWNPTPTDVVAGVKAFADTRKELIGLLGHLHEYQHWFKSIEDYHEFLGYVDSAWVGGIAGVLQILGATGDSDIHDLLDLSGRSLDLAIDTAQWLRHGSRYGTIGDAAFWFRDAHAVPFHGVGGVLGAAGAGLGIISGGLDFWSAYQAGDRMGMFEGGLKATASALYFVPGAQGVALALTGVSLAIDATQFVVEHWDTITDVAGEVVDLAGDVFGGAAEMAGDIVGGAVDLAGDVAGAVGDAVGGAFKAIGGWFS